MLDAKLVVNGVEVSLGQDSLKNMIDDIPERDECKNILGEIVKYGGAELRQNVARELHFPYRNYTEDDSNTPYADLVKMLAQDEDVDVLGTLMNDSGIRRKIDQTDLDRMLNMNNYNLLSTIAMSIEELVKCDTEALVGRLARHSDPMVRRLVIKKNVISPMLLKKLAEDEDPDVRSKANKLFAELNK